jgi:lysophospholipase L1-like esterase
MRTIPRTLAIAAFLVFAGAGAVHAQQPPEPQKESGPAKHWRERMELFRKENADLEADARYAVFVGDSITEGFALARFFPGKSVLNRGIGADTIGCAGGRGVLRRLDECVFDCRPAVVLIMIGVNDLAGDAHEPAFYVAGFGKIVDEIRKKLPKVKVVVQTCLPAGRKWRNHAKLNPRLVAYNDGLRKLAKERGLALVDVFALYADDEGFLPDDCTNDGLHLKRDAYKRWADAVSGLVP